MKRITSGVRAPSDTKVTFNSTSDWLTITRGLRDSAACQSNRVIKRLLLGRHSQQHIVMLGMGIFGLWMLLRNPDVEITYRGSTKPLPNQRFARVVFHLVGIVLVLGGLWGLWIDWHAGP